MLKKEVKKLSLSRGINLPAIQINEYPTNSNFKKQHKRGQSLDDFPDKKHGTGPIPIGEDGSDSKSKRSEDCNGNSSAVSDTSPASIISPIGHTLIHSAEHTRDHDLNRTLNSESFNILGSNLRKGIPDEPADEAIDIRIFFPNGTAVQFNVENGIDATAQDLTKLMAEHLGIDDCEVAEEALAIWLISPLLEIQLKSHHVPYEIFQKWPAFLRRFTSAEEEDIALDVPLLMLRRNVLLIVKREIQLVEKYERLTEVLYLHARDEFLSGRYPVDIETTLELVGLQLAIEFGPYDGNLRETLDLIYESLHELAPTPHIKAIRSFHLFGLRMMECKKGLENRVIDEYRTASTHFHSNYERHKEFLSILRKTPFYGAAFYSGTMDKNKTEQKGSDESEGSDKDVEKKAAENGRRQLKQQRTNSQTKLKEIVSPANLLDRLRRLLHPRNGHGQYLNGKGNGRREILIGINHGFITLIDPREHKVLEILQDSSPEGNMSLNDKISLFCAD